MLIATGLRGTHMMEYEKTTWSPANDGSRRESRARWRPVGCFLLIIGIFINVVVIGTIIIIPASMGAPVPGELIVVLLVGEIVAWWLIRFLWRRWVTWRSNRPIPGVPPEQYWG